MSSGERKWAQAPGGIAIGRVPERVPRTWEAVAASLCEAVRAGGLRTDGRAPQSEAVDTAARRRGMIV